MEQNPSRCSAQDPPLPSRQTRPRRCAHGASRLDWDVDLHIRCSRGFVRVVVLPLAGQMRPSVDDHPPVPRREAPALDAAASKALAHLLFPVLARCYEPPHSVVKTVGPRSTAYECITARTFLEDTFCPLGGPRRATDRRPVTREADSAGAGPS